MQINPDKQEFTQTMEEHRLQELVEETDPTMEMPVVFGGSKANLKKLQDDLRRAGYRKVYKRQ